MASQQDCGEYTDRMDMRSNTWRHRGPIILTVSQISTNHDPITQSPSSKGGLSFMMEDIQPVYFRWNSPSNHIVSELRKEPSLVVVGTERAAEEDYTRLLFKGSTRPTGSGSGSAQPSGKSAFSEIWFRDDLMNSISSQEGEEEVKVEGMCVGVIEANRSPINYIDRF
ncbi:uncharacterized protein L199_005257 [Kwoniella botswanensis]|uniref:uncharacterized protein n=1 Tax=Kwoniella botswanensis TaxID=1268659 RepID=UPI00315DCDE7